MNSDQAFDPLSLDLPNAAKILSAGGNGTITKEMLMADIAAGAPLGPDGRLNLLQYAAWLVREMARGSD
jgi:hypothetical protein